jgi:hypothetical protein
MSERYGPMNEGHGPLRKAFTKVVWVATLAVAVAAAVKYSEDSDTAGAERPVARLEDVQIDVPKPAPLPPNLFKNKEPVSDEPVRSDWKEQARSDLSAASAYFGDPELAAKQRLMDPELKTETLCRLSGAWLKENINDFITLWHFIDENRALWPEGTKLHKMLKEAEASPKARGRSLRQRGEEGIHKNTRRLDPEKGCGPLVVLAIYAGRADIQNDAPKVLNEISHGLLKAVDTLPESSESGKKTAKEAYEAYVRALQAVQRLGKR